MSANIYLFHGEDTYRSSQKVTRWLHAFRQKFGDINAELHQGKDLSASQVKESITTLPFLSEKKFVLIKDFLKDGNSEEQKKVADILEQTPEECIVIFHENGKADARTSLFKTLKKIATVETFSTLEPFEIQQWLQEEAKKRQLNLSHKHISFLAEYVGADLWQLDQELEKISLYSTGETSINLEELATLTNSNASSSIFALTDNIAQKQPHKALQTLSTLLQSGDNIIQILFMIIRHFRILIQVADCKKQNMSESAISKKLKQHPFTIKKSCSQVCNFSPKKLASIYRELLSIDQALKTGKIKISTEDVKHLRLLIEKLIVQLCQKEKKANMVA